MIRLITFLIFTFVVFCDPLFADFGPSPRTDDHLVTLQFPEWVGVWCTNDVTFDFSTMAGFPPATTPQYFYPTGPVASPYERVRILAITRSNWELSVSGGGDFDDGTGVTIPLSRLEWSRSGIGSWSDMSTSNSSVLTGSGPTFQRVDIDYRYEYVGDEADGSFTTTITYQMATTP